MPRAPEPFWRSSLKAVYYPVRRLILAMLGFFPFRGKRWSSLPQDIRRILCIRVDRVGDMVLSTPAFQALREALPQAHITVMASPANAPILECNPHVDEVVIYDRLARLPKKIEQLLQMRSRRFDLAIDLLAGDDLQTAVLAAMSGAPHRIGYAAFGREVFFNGPLVNMVRNEPMVDATLGLLKQIGIVSPDSRRPRIYLSADEKGWARQWLDEHGLLKRERIAIHPGAFYKTQRWPAEYYAALTELICRKTQAQVLLLGGPADAGIISEITARIKEDRCLCLQDDLRKCLAILSQCRMLVCNNSGPLHCAAALDIPTLSFMGPTVKEQWMPVGEIHRVFRRDDLPCIGCNSGSCRIETHDCMRLIRPEVVFENIRNELS